MAKISREEAIKIAQASRIYVHENEIDQLVSQLQAVLDYAERVQKVAADTQEPSTRKVNVFREDLVVPTDAELILRGAPQREASYFVVPVILHTT